MNICEGRQINKKECRKGQKEIKKMNEKVRKVGRMEGLMQKQ